jgi:hypothetical protein
LSVRCIFEIVARKGTLSVVNATVSFQRNGKVAERAGKSEDLPLKSRFEEKVNP